MTRTADRTTMMERRTARTVERNDYNGDEKTTTVWGGIELERTTIWARRMTSGRGKRPVERRTFISLSLHTERAWSG